MRSQHCGYWCPGAKAPGHQYPQYWLNNQFIGAFSYENIALWLDNIRKIKLHFEKKWPSRLRVKSGHVNCRLLPGLLSWYTLIQSGLCNSFGVRAAVNKIHGCPTFHYNNVIMSAMASQIDSLTIVYSTVYSWCRSKKTSKLRVTSLCGGNSPVTGEFRAQRAGNAGNVSIWWHHHANEWSDLT